MNKLAICLIGGLIFWALLLIAFPPIAVFCLAGGVLLLLVLYAGALAMGLDLKDQGGR